MSTITDPVMLDETGQQIVECLEDVVESLGGTSRRKTFGFIEHNDVLAPSQRIEYIGINKDYSPISITMGGGYNLGDWANFKVVQENKPYMVKADGTKDYALNESDYTKKADGTASDVANGSYSGAGAFSWIPRIYKRETIDGDDRKVEFQFVPGEGFDAVGFYDKDGNLLEGRWLPMFYASVSSNKAKTISGVAPTCTQTTDAQKTAVEGVGTRANFLGGPFVETLIDLMIMLAKTTDLQDFYGYGACDGYSEWSTTIPAQTVVNGGQFYGTSDKKSYNKIFHSVVLGSYMVWCRDPYEILDNGTLKVRKDYNIDLTGATYDNTGLHYSTSGGWQYPDKYQTVRGYGGVPVQPCAGSTATGGCDGLYTNAAIVAVCLRFGFCNDGLAAGPRARYWTHTASRSNWYLGFAVLLDPPVGVAA